MFEYSDQIVYFRYGDIHQYDTAQKTDLVIRQLSLVYTHNDPDKIAMGYSGTDNLVIIRKSETTHSKNFKTLKFDKNMKIIEKHQGYDERLNKWSREYDGDLEHILIKKRGSASYNSESVFGRFGDRVALPHNIYLKKEDNKTWYEVEPDPKKRVPISNLCYDKYEDSLLLIPMVMHDTVLGYDIEMWRRVSTNEGCEQKWELDRELKDFDIDRERTFSQVECGRSHILLGMTKREWYFANVSTPRIYILDKYTFKVLVSFEGCHPTFRDDYGTWFKDRLKNISEIPMLSKMSEDLLKIILLYVS